MTPATSRSPTRHWRWAARSSTTNRSGDRRAGEDRGRAWTSPSRCRRRCRSSPVPSVEHALPARLQLRPHAEREAAVRRVQRHSRRGRFTSSGRHGIAAFRNGFWYVDNNLDGVVDATYVFGGAGDIPLTGSIAYPGQDDLVVYRNGVWYVDYYYSRNGVPDRTSTSVAPRVTSHSSRISTVTVRRPHHLPERHLVRRHQSRRGRRRGLLFRRRPGDIPVAFDWDGDGKADLGIFRDGTWYISTRARRHGAGRFGYGAAGDTPLPGRFN